MKKRDWIIVGAAFVAIVVLVVVGLGSGRGRSRRAASQITDLVIKNKKKIVELSTIKYYDDLVLFDTRLNTRTWKVDTLAVVIARGTVNVGFNLADLQEQDVRFSGDTLYLDLGAPEVLDVVINPSDYEIFDNVKDWNDVARLPQLLQLGKSRMASDAEAAGVFDKAALSGAATLTQFFKSMGATEVVVNVKDKEQQPLPLRKE